MSEREESFDNWCDELGPERDLPLLAFNAGWNAALQSETVRELAALLALALASCREGSLAKKTVEEALARYQSETQG